MKTYRYTLEPYKGSSTRYTCPQCGSKKQFVRYIDTQTSQHVGDDTGRCNRQEKCGYHKKPNHIVMPCPDKASTKAVRLVCNNTCYRNSRLRVVARNDALITCPNSQYQASLNNYQHNQLVLYLHDTLGYPAMERVVDAYHIGTHGISTVFWQIDSKGQIRGGKVMAYNKDTGKRMKDIPNAIQWMHSIHKIEGFELKQCLFGEHLLRDNTKEVGIVESEKTALIAAALMPHMVWLATGGVNNLGVEKCSVLRNRNVTLYPDAGTYDKWLEISKHIPHCSISPMLEHGFAPGSDIADYLLAA